jgi:PKD repeat protein
MQKKNLVVLIIGCFLIMSNLGIAVNAIDTTYSNVKLISKDLQINNNEIKNTISTEEDINDNILDEKEIKNNNAFLQETNNIDEGIKTDNRDEEENNELNLDTLIQKEIFGHHFIFTNANAGGPYSGNVGDSIQFFSSSRFTEASYQWDFGDPNNPAKGYGKYPKHIYSEPGIYYTTLLVTLDDGEEYQDIASIYISQKGEHLKPYGGCNYEGEINTPILFDASQSTSIGEDIVEYIWYFGDGTIGYGKQISHSYKKEKVYLVSLEIKDTEGNTRHDVLHADIGRTYTNIWDFFVNTEGIVGNILELLANSQISGDKICNYFKIKMYTYYNNGIDETVRTVDINNFNDFPKYIDVNLDGDDDIVVNQIEFLKPVISASPFNRFPWFAFETTLSNIQLTSVSDITTNDDFTICLQFSLESLQEFLGLQEPIIRVGYQSLSGEEKPNNFKFTQVFRPYLLLRLFSGDNPKEYQQKNLNPNPLDKTNENIQNNKLQTINKVETQPIVQPIMYDNDEFNYHINQNTGIKMESEEPKYQPINDDVHPLYSTAIIPENGIRLESSDVNSFSLIASFLKTDETTKTTFRITFDSFTSSTLMHRKGQTYQDVDFKGSNADSKVTMSIIRETQQGIASLGIMVDPVQNFGFGIDIYRLENNARHIGFMIDNPPTNFIIFKENEDSQGNEEKHYFYLKNLPKRIDLEWLPRILDGYFTVAKDDPQDEFTIGICDDLIDPNLNLYMKNLPTYTSLSWEILYSNPNSISLISTTQGLNFTAELKNVSQPNQDIIFQATSNENMEIKFLWNILEGYFEIQHCSNNIDFDFSIIKENSFLDLKGNLIGAAVGGIIFNFIGLDEGFFQLSNDLTLEAIVETENYVKELSLKTDIEISTQSDLIIQWDQSMNFAVEATSNLRLRNLMLKNPSDYFSSENIVFSTGCRFGLTLGEDNQIQLGASGQIIINNLEGSIGNWYGSLATSTAGGSFDIILKPVEKYYQLDLGNTFDIAGFYFEYDEPARNIYDFVLEFDYFSMISKGSIWFNFGSNKPHFNLNGEDEIDLTNFHLQVGNGTPDEIDFTITNSHVYNAGNIFGQWDSSSLDIDAEVDFYWNINIETLNFGNWESLGNLQGSAIMNASWNDGSGSIKITIGDSGILHTLQITHDELILNLGTFNLNPGTITFEWQRETSTLPGMFNILNDGVSGDIALCKISYTNPQNPIEIELGSIDFQSGDIYMDWRRPLAGYRHIHIDSKAYLNIDPFKISWGSKKLTIDALELEPGEFKFSWDPATNKRIKINNGINSLGPGVTYENTDDEIKLSVNVANLRQDYSKTIDFICYNDTNYQGIYLDTSGQQLADLITIEAIKGDFGRKITLSGLKADGFILRKNLNTDKIDMEGRIYLVSSLTYSKLIDDVWKDLKISWNLDGDGIGFVEFDIDNSFEDDWNINDVYIKDVKISANIDNLAEYVKIQWDVDFDLQGYIKIDSNNESIAQIGILIQKDANGYYPRWGVYLYASTMAAENYEIVWDFSKPPGQWVLTTFGWIKPLSIDELWIAWNEKWYSVLNNGTPV